MEHLGFPPETVLIFFTVILVSIYFDLATHRNVEEISMSNAIKWTLFWISLALFFYGYVWLRFGPEWAALYLAGYVLEKSLSVDNLMVFLVIFASFSIKSGLQHRILYWGILGALIFRAVFVAVGTGIFLASPWVGFVFAAVVAWSAVQMLKGSGDEEEDIEDYTNHWSVRMTGKLLPVYKKLHLGRFFVRHKELLSDDTADKSAVTRNGAIYATPAFLCLMTIETSDIAFSFDSVPAVISVTQEPLLVYAAMIFAVLGLRSMYFVLAALNRYLVHLEKAVIALLFFISGKLALQSWNQIFNDTGIHISATWSLAIVITMLASGVIASFLFPKEENEKSVVAED